MKQISEKYPKVWEKCYFYFLRSDLMYDISIILINCDFKTLFGYLVLEFFPKHGIEIERKFGLDKAEPVIHYHVWREGSELHWTFKTPQEAIEKAFEILESQEE